jgi:hypothetical protein
VRKKKNEFSESFDLIPELHRKLIEFGISQKSQKIFIQKERFRAFTNFSLSKSYATFKNPFGVIIEFIFPLKDLVSTCEYEIKVFTLSS